MIAPAKLPPRLALKNVPVMNLIGFRVIPSDRGHRNEQRFPLFSI